MSDLQRLIADSFSHFSSQIALVDESDRSLSYAELNLGVKALTAQLDRFGELSGRRICIYMPKSLESVCAILSIIQLGGAYIPLDPEAPPSRNSYIIGDAQSPLVITTAELAPCLVPLLGPCRVHDITVLDTHCQLVQLDDTRLEKLSVPPDLAYILYTSGSTGQPKGVMITHHNAKCFIHWGVNTFGLTEYDVLSSIAPFHFDLSVFDLYAGLACGARIILIQPASVKNPMILSALIDRFNISVWYATPTTLKMMLRFGRMDRYSHSSLKTILFAGEVFPITPLNELRSRWPQATFYNLYGPTETNVCTYFELPTIVDPEQTTPFPIGQPCSYAFCAVDDGHQIHDLTPGVEGELIVAGESVMGGYLNQPERNETALLQHEGKRYYRTGDIVRVDDHLHIHYISRKDRMVKRHGFRIELGEIEASLHNEPRIAEAGVIQRMAGSDLGETKIVVFYSTNDAQQALDVPYLQSFLLQHLPSYMLPDQFIHLAEMPKTSTHKVDYSALSTLN